MASAYSTNKKVEFLKVFKKKACNISASCDAVKIDRQTYYNWMAKDEKFKTSVLECQEGLIDFAESMLMQNINKGDNTATIFFLKCKGKSRGYIEKQEIEHTGESLNRPTKIEIVAPNVKKTNVKKSKKK